MASHQLIDAYVDQLSRRLPADTVDELADGLHETWRRHLEEGLTSAEAAEAAIAEFGTPAQVTDAFVTHAAGRRAARLLLATGPVFGVCWGASLIVAHAWTWSVPAAARGLFAVALVGVVVCLIAAATSRHDFRRTRLGHVGAGGLIALDAVMLTAVALAAPALVWPMTIAIPASLARVGLTLRHARRLSRS
jgi:hypothetical protein